MAPAAKARSAVQRAVENARYREVHHAVGIVRVTVMVPADRIPELRALTLDWRKNAKLLLAADEPSADQILQIHTVARKLRLALPISAFETRATAANWLLAQAPKLGVRRSRGSSGKTTE